MATMKAIRMHGFGGPDVLRLEEVPVPTPGPGEVLIRVMAASINPIDWKVRGGFLRDMLQKLLPLTPGRDAAGVVESIGDGVTHFKVGDEVYTYVDFSTPGCYAGFVVAKLTMVAAKPRTVDFVHAAAVPVVATTAFQSLFDAANLASGQTVLIHGAAGGVGSMAVQLAKIKGARVIATASGDGLEQVRELGADQVIDYKRDKFDDVVHDADVVFDTVGGDTLARSYGVLRKGGTVVTIAGQPDEKIAAGRSVRALFRSATPDSALLADLAQHIDRGRLRTRVDHAMPLRDAAKAQEGAEKGQIKGKIVLVP